MEMSQDNDPFFDTASGPVNDEEAKASKKKLIGGNWENAILFYPEAEREDSTDYHNITEDELMTKLQTLVGVDEQIQHVWDYKVPLTKQQITYALFYHEFLILETNRWWWSIEKHPDAITIQRSGEASFVKDYFRRKPRIIGRARLCKSTGSVSIYDLFKWIKTNGELRKEYNVTTSNCQHFVEAVLDHVADSKNAKSNPLLVKSNPRSLRFPGSFTSKSGNNNPSGNGNETNADVQRISARDGVDEFTKNETKEIQEIVPSVGRRRSRSFHGTATLSLKPSSDTELSVDEDYLPFKSELNEEAEKSGPRSRHGSDAYLTGKRIEPRELPPSMLLRILEDRKDLRESDLFQDEWNPDTASDTPSLTCEEFNAGGKNSDPILDFDAQALQEDIRKLKLIVKAHERRIKTLEDKVAKPAPVQTHAERTPVHVGPALPPDFDAQALQEDIRKLKVIVKAHERRIKTLEDNVSKKEKMSTDTNTSAAPVKPAPVQTNAEPTPAHVGPVLPPDFDAQALQKDIRKLKLIVKAHDRRIKTFEDKVAQFEANTSKEDGRAA